jgi:hypothetical protein
MSKWKLVTIDSNGNVYVDIVDDSYLQANAYSLFSGQVWTPSGVGGCVLRIEKFLDVPVEESDVQA